MMYSAVSFHISSLPSLDRTSTIHRVIDDILTRVGSPRPRVVGQWRQHFVYSSIYKTNRWRKMETESLNEIGVKLLCLRLFADAERICAHACAHAEAHYGTHAPETLHSQILYIESLIGMKKFAQAQEISRKILAARSYYETARYKCCITQYLDSLSAHELGQHQYASDTLQSVLQDI